MPEKRWCGPCRLFAPVYKRLSGADEYASVSFFKVDGESAPKSRATVEIPNLPYVAAYRNGEFVEGVTTAKEPGFRKFLKRALDVGPAE